MLRYRTMKTKFTVVSLLLLLHGCSSITRPPAPPQMNEVERLRNIFPVYHDFIEVPHQSRFARSDLASVGRGFKSNAPYEDVKRFYVEKFTPDGWQAVQDEKLFYLGVDLGGRELIFQKGEYLITIQKGDKYNSDWDYVVSFIWKKTLVALSNTSY